MWRRYFGKIDIPNVLFNSSVLPSASKITSFFGLRSPVYKEDRPLSPVFVYILNLFVGVESFENSEMLNLLIVIPDIPKELVRFQPIHALEIDLMFRNFLANISIAKIFVITP